MQQEERYRYKMIVAYEGTNYSGWQVQPNAVSIQALIQNALGTIIREEVHVCGSGRTDAGVHALAQPAHFDCSQSLDLNHVLRAMNGILPRDVRIMDLFPVSSDFHARFSAKRKIYRYSITMAQVQSPFRRRYALHFRHALDIELMREAASRFLGTHDFTSFANVSGPKSHRRNPVKTIYRLDIHQEGDGLTLEFEGSGFLYKMIRNIVGCLLEVASKKRSIEDIPRLLELKDRRQAGPAAAAHGLSLIRVFYDE